jgi:hypothetical protein
MPSSSLVMSDKEDLPRVVPTSGWISDRDDVMYNRRMYSAAGGVRALRSLQQQKVAPNEQGVVRKKRLRKAHRLPMLTPHEMHQVVALPLGEAIDTKSVERGWRLFSREQRSKGPIEAPTLFLGTDIGLRALDALLEKIDTVTDMDHVTSESRILYLKVGRLAQYFRKILFLVPRGVRRVRLGVWCDGLLEHPSFHSEGAVD